METNNLFSFLLSPLIFYKLKKIYWSIVVSQCLLISAIQQCESAICIHISPLFWISFPFRSMQNIEQSSLSIQYSHYLCILYIKFIYISSNLPMHPTPISPHSCSKVCVSSLCLCLYFCFVNRFICIIFLDSTYMIFVNLFVFLFLTYFTRSDSLQVPLSSFLNFNCTTIYGQIIVSFVSKSFSLNLYSNISIIIGLYPGCEDAAGLTE